MQFCPSCGTKVTVSVQEDPHCVGCGEVLKAGAKFCPKCGTKVSGILSTKKNSVVRLEDLDIKHLNAVKELIMKASAVGNDMIVVQVENELKNERCIDDFVSLEQLEHDAEIQSCLGLCYEYGLCGAAQDGKRAFGWYEKSANQGNAWGQHNVAYCYQVGLGCEASETKAYEWYKKAARQGYEAAVITVRKYDVG